MVFEAQGGMTKEAAAVLHVLLHAVAQAENADPHKCKNHHFQSVALPLARHGASAIKRRRAPLANATANACQSDVERSMALEVPA